MPLKTVLLQIRTVLIAERSEEHTSELQSRLHLVCRLLLEKKKKEKHIVTILILTHQQLLSSSIFLIDLLSNFDSMMVHRPRIVGNVTTSFSPCLYASSYV